MGAFLLLVNWCQPGDRSLQFPQRGGRGESLLATTFWGFGVLGTALLVACFCGLTRRCIGAVESEMAAAAARIKRHGSLNPSPAGPLERAKTRVEQVGKFARPAIGMVYYPLIPLALLAMARLPFFDRWGWPPVLTAFLLVLALAPAVAAVRLHFVAGSGKQQVVDAAIEYRKKAMECADKPVADELQQQVDAIQGVDAAAFLPFWREPAVIAILASAAALAGALVLVRWGPAM